MMIYTITGRNAHIDSQVLVCIERLTAHVQHVQCMISLVISWFGHRASSLKYLILLHANNKGADQSVHPHMLICTLVIHYLEKRVYTLATYKISWFLLVYVAKQDDLNLAWSLTPKTGFLASRPFNNFAIKNP